MKGHKVQRKMRSAGVGHLFCGVFRLGLGIGSSQFSRSWLSSSSSRAACLCESAARLTLAFDPGRAVNTVPPLRALGAWAPLFGTAAAASPWVPLVQRVHTVPRVAVDLLVGRDHTVPATDDEEVEAPVLPPTRYGTEGGDLMSKISLGYTQDFGPAPDSRAPSGKSKSM